MATIVAGEASESGTPRPGISEDWLSVIIGLLIFALALASIPGTDLLGWVVNTSVWTDWTKALSPAGKSYASLGGLGSLVATYLVLLAVLALGAAALRRNVGRFIVGFTAVFWISYVSWIVGSNAYLAVNTPANLQKFGIDWSLKLTSEGGYIIALVVGLVIANFFPRFAAWINEAILPELYIKIAIVGLGAFLAVTAVNAPGLATSVLWRGIAAIIEAYLIYWSVVYFIARKWFGFSREWAAPLASGISICGVAAAIATGGAIRARPAVAVLVSSLVVIFAVVELLVLPFVAQTWLSHEPLVAGAWMGLAIKTDGAALAGGNIAEALILAKNAAEGIHYQPGWIVGTAATVKVFIDVFIGVWAFILAFVWTNYVQPRPAGERAKAGEIWLRFPKFILGYVLTFALALYLALNSAPAFAASLKTVIVEANIFRGLFFVFTFFSIGVLSNFRKLWQEGLGKLVAVYVVSLVGFVIWVGFVISWLFFHGVKPPLIH